jgi:hypothetical protein
MSITSQVVLRYTGEGHLRFDLPQELREPGLAARLVEELEAREGVYRVDLAVKRGKLSIRYLSHVCAFADVVRWLHQIVNSLSSRAAVAAKRTQGVMARQTSRSLVPVQSGTSSGLASWLRGKLQEIRETVQALNIVLRRSLNAAMAAAHRRPRWVKEFMNDLLMLYLIKLHWHHIMTEWLPRPWTYRYEWLATIYLIYLSVQARLPRNA